MKLPLKNNNPPSVLGGTILGLLTALLFADKHKGVLVPLFILSLLFGVGAWVLFQLALYIVG